MPDLRILVTGARSVTDDGRKLIRAKLFTVCAATLSGPGKVTIVQGRCPYGGADKVAEDWATDYGVASEPYPADWDRLGAKAGPIRNTEMVAAGADICLAFPDAASRGTWDCIRKAADAGIPVRIYPLGARRG